MTEVPGLYYPLNEYKPFGSELGIVDGPYEWFSWLGLKIPFPFPTRMTVIRLGNGELFLHSPIRFDPALAVHLSTFGRVRHLVAPNKLHYAHIAEWARAFPDAITWALPQTRARARSSGIELTIDKELTSDAPDEWRGEIEQRLIPGKIFEEVAFCHTLSRTLVLSDVIMNFELDRLSEPQRTLVKVAGVCAPQGKSPAFMRLFAFLPRKREVRAAVEAILSWQPERIVISHGRCFDSEATRELRRVFGWALDD
jgi:hypothetical protein